MRRVSFSIRRTGAAILLGIAGGTMAVAASSLLASAPFAFAATSPFELYCPNTPVGTIVLNNAVTAGTISPATLSAGTQFNLTGFQTTVALPSQIVQASQALGNTAVMGSASSTVDATGATPASISSGTISFSVSIPSPIPSNGLTLELPASASSIGPFTATGGAIALSLASTSSLSVSVTPGSPPLSLSCKAYANNAIPTSGITTSTPPGSPISPQIATATASGSSSSSATTPTTAPPTSASSSSTPSTPASTAYTGPGPQLWLVALIGLLLIVVAFVSYLVGPGGRGPLRGRLRFAEASRTDGLRTGPPLRHGSPSVSSFSRSAAGPPDLWVDPQHLAPPSRGAGGSESELWIDGWGPGASGPRPEPPRRKFPRLWL